MSSFHAHKYGTNAGGNNDAFKDKDNNEINFGSPFDFDQISELTKHNGDQIKSLAELLLSQADEKMNDSLITLTELVQQFLQSSDYAFQYARFLKDKELRYEDGVTQKDEELLALTQKCRMQEEDLLSKQDRIDSLSRECQNLENMLQDYAFQKNELTSEAAELRESIKLSDQNYKQFLQQSSFNEQQLRKTNEVANLKAQALIDSQSSQIEKLIAENKALGVALDEKINENKQITQSLQKMQRESDEFEIEFKKWEKSFEADQKVKVAMIDKLQCEMERLTEQLQQKEEELSKLKQQQLNSSPAIEFEISPMLLQSSSSQINLPQEYAQNEQISHEDFLNQTQDFLEIQEFEKGGNLQDFIEDEGDGSEQRVEQPEQINTITRFASFIGEQRFSTEADLQQELFLVEQKSSETKTTELTAKTDDAEPVEIRRDPEEEYFRLSVLSLKMQYNERDVDYVFQISSSKLYRRCKKESVPFHQWYNWIEYQLLLIDQKDNPTPEKQRQPTTRNNKLIALDKNLSAALNRQKVHQEETRQPQQRPDRETFFQRVKRNYWR